MTLSALQPRNRSTLPLTSSAPPLFDVLRETIAAGLVADAQRQAGVGWRVDPATHPLDVLRNTLPASALIPSGARHVLLWDWLSTLRPNERPPAFIGNWPRGGAKSTSAEQACVDCAVTLRRRFALYVCGTQEQAEAHLDAIAGWLEQIGEARSVNAYGNSDGWTSKLLRTAQGWNALAVGLDTNVRGAKLDELRPDLIILDDVDGLHDSPGVTGKRLRTITRTILPAGSTDCAIIFIQNTIHRNSIMAQVLDGRAEILLNRVVSSEPAVHGLAYERREREDGTPYYAVTEGEATWPEGQSIAVVEGQINDWGLTAVLEEAQHAVEDVDGGMFSHLVYRHTTWEQLPALIRKTVWCDPAVTATDKSDCNGIQADGRGTDGLIYRLWSWEQRSTPQETLCRAIIKAVEIGAEVVGVETDQGGDTWRSVFLEAMRQLSADEEGLTREELTTQLRTFRAMFATAKQHWIDLAINAGVSEQEALEQFRPPVFRSARAGSAQASKAERAARMLSDYERGRIVHVTGTHYILESALRRFPLAKPYDLVDASYWSWEYLSGGGAGNSAVGAFSY